MYFVEVARIGYELMLMFRSIKGMVSPNNVATLLWDIPPDAAQYFYTFPTMAQYHPIGKDANFRSLGAAQPVVGKHAHIVC